MMRAWGSLAVAAMASGVLACSLLKKPGAAVDAGEDAASARLRPRCRRPRRSGGRGGQRVGDDALPRREARGPRAHHRGAGRQHAHAGRHRRRPGRRPEEGHRGREARRARRATTWSWPTTRRTRPASSMGWIAESAFSGAAASQGAEPEPRGDGGARASARRRRCRHEAARPRLRLVRPSRSTSRRPTARARPATRSCGAMCRLTCKADAECGVATAHCSARLLHGPRRRALRASDPGSAELDLAPHLAAHALLAPVGAGDEPRRAPRGEQLALLTERGQRARSQDERARRAACGSARRRGRRRSAGRPCQRAAIGSASSDPPRRAQRGAVDLLPRARAQSPRAGGRRAASRRRGSAAR